MDTYLSKVDGLRVHERRTGTGPPVVFVHGLAVSSRYFRPTMYVLASRFTCRAPDLPGFGLSDNPPSPLDVQGLADALAAWLRHHGLERAALVGNSAGCQYIVDAVSRHPDLRGPLVLIGPTIDRTARTVGAQVGRWLRTGSTPDIAQVPILLRDLVDAGLPRVARTFAAVLHDPIEDKLASVSPPALVVRGSNDHLVPKPWAAEVARLLPQGSLAEVAGGGHVVNFTRPHDVAALIARFGREVGYG